MIDEISYSGLQIKLDNQNEKKIRVLYKSKFWKYTKLYTKVELSFLKLSFLQNSYKFFQHEVLKNHSSTNEQTSTLEAFHLKQQFSS